MILLIAHRYPENGFMYLPYASLAWQSDISIMPAITNPTYKMNDIHIFWDSSDSTCNTNKSHLVFCFSVTVVFAFYTGILVGSRSPRLDPRGNHTSTRLSLQYTNLAKRDLNSSLYFISAPRHYIDHHGTENCIAFSSKWPTSQYFQVHFDSTLLVLIKHSC